MTLVPAPQITVSELEYEDNPSGRVGFNERPSATQFIP